MKMKLFTKLAGPLSFVIGVILIKLFGTTVGFVFMISTVVVLVAAGAVFRGLTKNERSKHKAALDELLAGSTMYDHLIENPGRLDLIRGWSESEKTYLLEGLEVEDAKRVKLLLDGKSNSE